MRSGCRRPAGATLPSTEWIASTSDPTAMKGMPPHAPLDAVLAASSDLPEAPLALTAHCPSSPPAISTIIVDAPPAFAAPTLSGGHLRHKLNFPISPLVVPVHSSICCCPLALAHHSASGLAINICVVLVEEGGPRVEAKRRGGDPLPRASCRATFPERAGSRVSRSAVAPRERDGQPDTRERHPNTRAPHPLRHPTADERPRAKCPQALRRRLPGWPRRRGRTRSRVAGRGDRLSSSPVGASGRGACGSRPRGCARAS